MHAQPGALAVQMFTWGRTEDGSSRLPTRTTRNCGRASDRAKRCVPQAGQNWRVIAFPLWAALVCSAKEPDTASAEAGTSMFTVPLALRCWQCRHQHTRTVSGSADSLNLTAPHKQCPVRSAMGALAECGRGDIIPLRWVSGVAHGPHRGPATLTPICRWPVTLRSLSGQGRFEFRAGCGLSE